MELTECLYDILGWFEVCLKKITTLDKVEDEKISGIRFANNIKKHSTSLFRYTLQTFALFPSGSLFPSENLYPSDFNIFWNSLPLDNVKYKNQYNNYVKHFKDKDLYPTLNEIFAIIKKYY